ncbi:winged helix-turn-helix domain-containing protein [Kutzneria sp. 744]|uniref:winged helix-turn-helix domain-containing protein n=1 Tax=Kutzneria sp. (strain 744) TaxID=345341 RepID=UPI0006949480|nr:crosslink repair DNA glycosylase YcaQ family protein [Kutzneria sp. 744]
MSSLAARRTALAAQGFAQARPSGVVTRRHLQGVLARTQLLQLDSVNVAVRAHYVPIFSRLGSYPMELLEEAAWSNSVRRPRLLVEYWAHEASLVPVADWPLLRWRMRQHKEHPSKYWQSSGGHHLADEVVTAVKELGPITAGALEEQMGLKVARERAPGGWWHRSDVKRACEYLFATGELTTGTRRGFERHYDISERVLPPEVLAAPELSQQEASRQLIAKSAVALGVATEPDLRDYYRLKPEWSRAAVAELVAEGVLEPVEVEGWRHQAYRHVDARTPRRVQRERCCARRSLIWSGRTSAVDSLRIEIYVPSQAGARLLRVPFLLSEDLVARVDVKADRLAGVLRVPGAFAELGVDHAEVARELAVELRLMADWLGLDGVVVGKRGDLASRLGALV